MILTSLIISLFCCGLQIVTEEGQLLYFLRKPFENASEIIKYLAKPLILCITCTASFWGIVIYYILHGELSIYTIICCVISAFLNNVFYFGYEKYI